MCVLAFLWAQLILTLIGQQLGQEDSQFPRDVERGTIGKQWSLVVEMIFDAIHLLQGDSMTVLTGHPYTSPVPTAHEIFLRPPHCVMELKELYLFCLVDDVERFISCRDDRDHQRLLEFLLYSESRLRQRPATHDYRFGAFRTDGLLYRFS
ncbi:hypothetical protein SAMN04488123_12138 [Natribacillus halophilus]|uniref:Uncharacterized protein n=1 Tax=Natribacillus halophilus TaxID=549003 RepID=A0A1G8RZ78_9BACI|nr:hypothetical protein SAMN04488123_12138 [Natribacillus halophilus]